MQLFLQSVSYVSNNAAKERIYQNYRVRYILRQEGGKGRANNAAAPSSRVQGAEKWAAKQTLYMKYWFAPLKTKKC